MKYWVIGFILTALAGGLLYASSAVSSGAPTTTSWLLLLGFAVVVAGIFATIARAVKSDEPHAMAAQPAGAPRFEIEGDAPIGSQPWAGWQRTLGVMLVGLAGLLIYVGIYIGALAGVVDFIIYLGLFLTAALMVYIVFLTSGKTE